MDRFNAKAVSQPIQSIDSFTTHSRNPLTSRSTDIPIYRGRSHWLPNPHANARESAGRSRRESHDVFATSAVTTSSITQGAGGSIPRKLTKQEHCRVVKNATDKHMAWVGERELYVVEKDYCIKECIAYRVKSSVYRNRRKRYGSRY